MSDDLNDGSVDAAVLDMPDIEELEQSEGKSFQDDRKPEPKAEPEPKEPDAKVKSDAKAEPAAEDDEDYLEFPPEAEGKEASRVKLAEVIEKYRKADDLERQLKEAQNVPRWTPPEVTQQITQHVQAQQQTLAEMRKWQQYNQPQAPDPRQVDPNDANQLARYHAEQNRYLRLVEAHNGINAEAAQIERNMQQQQSVIFSATMAREKAELLKFWPEAGEEKGASKIYADLKTHYGLDQDIINSATDHRFYKLAKDALAFREAQAKQQEAVKVVKAKPKIISGSARSSTSAPARRSNDAFGRLQTSGSLEDAADAFEGLL